MTTPIPQANTIAGNTDLCQPYFDKTMTNIIKAVALIMMFVHHFFMVPDWWLDGIFYPRIAKYAYIFFWPTKLCVPIFCFLTGYFFYFNRHKNLRYSFRKITDFTVFYWSVFFPIALIAVLFVRYEYKPIPFFLEMFALTRPTMFFCWYVYFYYFIMLSMPLLARIMPKDILAALMLSILGIPFFLQLISLLCSSCSPNVLQPVVNNLQAWFPNVLIGFIFARHDLFVRFDKFLKGFPHNNSLGAILCLVLVLLIPMGRFALPGMTLALDKIPRIHSQISLHISLDVIYTPVFIYFLVSFWNRIKQPTIRLIFTQIGKYSMLMWFIHCVFFDN